MGIAGKKEKLSKMKSSLIAFGLNLHGMVRCCTAQEQITRELGDFVREGKKGHMLAVLCIVCTYWRCLFDSNKNLVCLPRTANDWCADLGCGWRVSYTVIGTSSVIAPRHWSQWLRYLAWWGSGGWIFYALKFFTGVLELPTARNFGLNELIVPPECAELKGSVWHIRTDHSTAQLSVGLLEIPRKEISRASHVDCLYRRRLQRKWS